MRIHSILDPVEYEHRTSIPAILLTLLIGLVLGAAALVWFVSHPKNGFWNEMAARITGRSLALEPSSPTVGSKVQHLQRLETVVYTMDKIEEGSREASKPP